MYQGSHKNLRKKFHDFSMTSPGQNPNFQTKKYQYLFLRPMYQFVESIIDRHRCTLTQTHMIWSRPTHFSTDFTHRQNLASAQLPQATRSQTGKWEWFESRPQSHMVNLSSNHSIVQARDTPSRMSYQPIVFASLWWRLWSPAAN